MGNLYINYRLELPDESPILESEDIICLLKDRKELYIQKDYLTSKTAICRYLSSALITQGLVMLWFLQDWNSGLWLSCFLCCSDCRELVKLFTTEKSFVEELKNFLEELVMRISVSTFTPHLTLC